MSGLLLVLLLALVQSDTARDLTVSTFNVRYGTAEDGENHWRARRGLLFAVLRKQDADVVGLQKALRFQLDEIGAAFPEHAELGVGRGDGVAAGEYAAILYRRSRFDLAEQGTFWLSPEPEVPGSVGWGNRIPRTCTWARLLDAFRALHADALAAWAPSTASAGRPTAR